MRDSIENYIKKSEQKYATGTSRYRSLLVLELPDGTSCLETMPKVTIRESNDDNIYYTEASKVDRLDLVAYNYYNNPTLYWVIAYMNNIIDPLVLDVATVLRIPSSGTLWGYKGILM